VYRRSLGPLFDNKKENWRILTNEDINAMVKKPTITETIRLNRIPKKVLYMNLEATRLRGKPRNGWQDEVREDARIAGGKGWKDRVYNREEWK